MNRHSTIGLAVLILAGAATMQAQTPAKVTSSTRIKIHKEAPTTGTASGTYVAPTTVTPSPATPPIDTMATPDTMFMPDTITQWYTPTARAHCSTIDLSAERAVSIKSSLYDPNAGMISPDSAKIIALCAVPGQIGGGEMNLAGGRTEYAVDIIPNHKKTHAKVIVDAMNGSVLSSKQFGGLRGLAGWVRESADHKSSVKAATKAARDTGVKRDTIPEF